MQAKPLAPHPDVVDTPLDRDETVLLHLGTKRYFSLNASGGAIWRALKEGRTPEAMTGAGVISIGGPKAFFIGSIRLTDSYCPRTGFQRPVTSAAICSLVFSSNQI
jgi:hypothetical protein